MMFKVTTYVLASLIILVNLSLTVVSIFWLPDALGILVGLVGASSVLLILHRVEAASARQEKWLKRREKWSQ